MMFESEERQIAERIKDFIKSKEYPEYFDIMLRNEYFYKMLRNGRILRVDDYSDMVNSDKINPMNAYVDIGIGSTPWKATFYYPLLDWYADFLDAYLSKLGFYYENYVFPATGLKYVALAVFCGGYLSIELVNLDTAVSNTNLRTIVFEVLGDKLMSGEKDLTEEEYDKIRDMYESQKLFAGYTSREAYVIISGYYDKGNKSSAKEVARIGIDYYRIFQPYTVCYDTDDWKEVDCLSIR